MLQKLGFTIHPDKSILIPTQVIVFLGFVINSLDMTISLTPEKIRKILHMVRHILYAEYITSRAAASCIGLLVSSFPAVQFGPLYYRNLEICKNRALYHHAKGNFDTSIVLTVKAFSELSWWLDNVQTVSRPIKTPSIDLTVYSDASLEGWGGTDLYSTVGGRWSVSELPLHINTLELHAAKLCLFSLAAGLSNLHIHILLDNTTAISYNNHMGGTHSQICNDVTNLIWSWCKDKGIWLSAAHTPGHENFIADYKSRHFQDNKEWSLNFSAFLSLTQLFYFPEIDLFASRLNHVVPKFVSYKPEPGAWATDAFSLNWHSLQFYAFPSFSIIGKVLAKIRQVEAQGILIVPLWSTQPWFPIAMSLIVSPTHVVKGKEGSSLFARQKRDGASSAQTSEPIGYFSFRSMLRGFELPEDTWALINSSWRDSTKCQYNSALRKWLSYCTERSVHSASPSINDVLTFLTHLYKTGLSYSTISSVKSVLSTLIHIPGITKIAEHPLVQRLITGIFNSRPTLPRYNFIWYTSIVINFLKGLDYDYLSHKLAVLLTILSGQRVSTVHKFRLSQLHITKDIAIFIIPSLLKHTILACYLS